MSQQPILFSLRCVRTPALRRAVLLAAIAASVAACAPQTRVVGGGSGPVLSSKVKLAPGQVKADISVVGDATQILKEAVQDSLQAEGMQCTPPAAGCPTIDVAARLLQPARAFAGTSPPIRVVELVASFRSGAQSSTVSYQRTVAVPGNMSTATWMRISDALTTDLASDFGFRSSRSGIVVRLPSWATMTTTLPRVSTPAAFHVAITGDSRADDDAIGSVGGREVRLARRATDYITEMLTDELRASGHLIVPARDGRLVGSELEKFWVTATESGMGWQARAEIEVALEVAPPPGVKRKKAERHRCSVTEKIGHRPTEPDLARVLQGCLGQLVQSMRNDPAWTLGS